jgi:hypothetical protein
VLPQNFSAHNTVRRVCSIFAASAIRSHPVFGNCPACKNTVPSLKVLKVKAICEGSQYDGVVYCCPSCHVILGAGIDPVLLANQTIKATKKH